MRRLDIGGHHKFIYVNCGHCPACLMQKANSRAAKIRAHHPYGMTCYFVTLTYKNEYIPYILPGDLGEASKQIKLNPNAVFNIPVYRDNQVRYFKGTRKISRERKIIDLVPYSTYLTDEEISLLPLLRRKSVTGYQTINKISICHYGDMQKFIKRLRINFQREYGYRLQCSYYGTSEYGSESLRGHLHALLWLPSALSFDEVRNLVVKAWPYASSTRTRKYIEVARDASKYVASYVNCSSETPSIFRDTFHTKHSHSTGFAFDDPAFDLAYILHREKTEGTTYVHKDVVTKSNGKVSLYFPLPSFIRYRFFPFIKGFSRLSDISRISVLREPRTYIRKTAVECGTTETGLPLYSSCLIDNLGFPVQFTDKEFQYVPDYVDRVYYRYWQPLGYSREDFARTVNHFYHAIQSDNIKNNHLLSDYELPYRYDNIEDFKSDNLHHGALQEFLEENSDPENYLVNCNQFPFRVSRTHELELEYQNNIKHRKLNSLNNV